jgi:glutathione S-transferase
MYLLHYAPDNASLIIRLALEEIGAPYRTALVDRSTHAQDSAAYRAVTPTGLIPALQTATATLFETGAILLWLSETHGQLAPQPNTPDRADFLKWLFFTANTLHADIRLHFYPDRFAPPTASPEFRKATEARILSHLGLLETLAARKPAYFTPATPSVLSLYVCTLCRWLALYPADRHGTFTLATFPHLHTLAVALQSRPAARSAALAEGLGDCIFTAPQYAQPPEGSAT